MRALGWFLVFLGFAVPGVCQQSQQDVSALLLHKTFLLRGLWQNDSLHFDAEGHLKNSSPTTTPLAAGIEITKVEVKKNRLVLVGERLSALYENGSLHMEEMEKSIHLEIEAPASGDYRVPLQAVFSPNLSALEPDVPKYWKPCVTGEVAALRGGRTG